MRTRIYLRSHGHNKSSGRVKLKIFENQGITNHSTRPENALQVNYGPRIFCDTSLPEFSHSLSLDATGGSVFLNLLRAAEGALIRAAASTQPLCCFVFSRLRFD